MRENCLVDKWKKPKSMLGMLFSSVTANNTESQLSPFFGALMRSLMCWNWAAVTLRRHERGVRAAIKLLIPAQFEMWSGLKTITNKRRVAKLLWRLWGWSANLTKRIKKMLIDNLWRCRMCNDEVKPEVESINEASDRESRKTNPDNSQLMLAAGAMWLKQI